MQNLKSLVRLILDLFLACIIQGCYPASESEIRGDYQAAANWGIAALDLRADGTFVEVATLKNGITKRIQGSWEFRREGSASKVFRKPCFRFSQAEIMEQEWDYCNFEADKYASGRLQIIVDSDLGFGYNKDKK